MSRLFKVYLICIAAWLFFSGVDTAWSNPLRLLALLAVTILSIYYIVRFFRKLIRKFLWRIRRKLILSYIFIGFVPLVLLFILTVLTFWIFMGQATSAAFNSALDGYLAQTKMEGKKLLHLTQLYDPETAKKEWLEDVAEADREWLQLAEIAVSSPEKSYLIQGKSVHELPNWLKEKQFSGLVFRDEMLWLTTVIREPDDKRTLQIHVPVSAPLLELIKKKIGADINYAVGGKSVKNELDVAMESSSRQPKRVWWDLPVPWLSLPDQRQWLTGEEIIKEGKTEEEVDVNLDTGSGVGVFSINTNVSRVFDNIFSRSSALQKIAYIIILAVAVTFLFIELISFVFGFWLAKSITASVHNLFEGTERIKKGDFHYRIKPKAQDQLGDLALSFNSMTESIQNLLKERAEKERLAEALHIARQMQERLLPQKITSIGSIEIAALNLPAQEMCGDYYDIIRRSDKDLGIIIADVSGKGPSAALYMAEVKGVMLSISQRSTAPREVMLEANNILAPTLDSRNFITMTYAMVDEHGRWMKLCRAGHNPLLHYSVSSTQVEILQPRGIGLGLGKNGIFENALEEVERKLDAGDILVFYTDGLTEAMNSQNQLYGLPRLIDILLRNKESSAEGIKDAIFRDLEVFLSQNLPQDDITLLLLKMT